MLKILRKQLCIVLLFKDCIIVRFKDRIYCIAYKNSVKSNEVDSTYAENEVDDNSKINKIYSIKKITYTLHFQIIPERHK